MRITSKADADALAAITRIERERREWLEMFGFVFCVGSPGHVAAMRSYDKAASEALRGTGLADAACTAVAIATSVEWAGEAR